MLLDLNTFGEVAGLRYDINVVGLFCLVCDTREPPQARRVGLLDFGPLIAGADTVFGESGGGKGGARNRARTSDG